MYVAQKSLNIENNGVKKKNSSSMKKIQYLAENHKVGVVIQHIYPIKNTFFSNKNFQRSAKN